MRKFILTVAVAALATLGLALPAQGSTANVHLDVDLVGAVAIADCDLTVPDGSNGIALLDEALDTGCIDSYETRDFGALGDQVTCINDICQTPDETLNILFWGLYVNCSFSPVGVSFLSLSDGDVVEFSYETWVTFPAELEYACAVPGA